MMPLLCGLIGHRLQVLDVTYAPPLPNLKISGSGPDFFHDYGRWALEKSCHGVSTFLMKCDRCGMLDKKECLGQQTSMRQLEKQEQHIHG